MTGGKLSYSFMTLWLDHFSNLQVVLKLTVFPETSEVELWDVKNQRMFLRRTYTRDVSVDRLYPGAKVTVMSRLLEVVDFADEHTRAALGKRSERTLAMVKPHAVQHLGEIVTMIEGAGFAINQMRMVHLTRADAERFYAVHRGKPFFDTLASMMSSDRIVAMELVKGDAVRAWRELIGPTDSNVARAEAPGSIRARFGVDKTQNACHGSDADQTAEEEIAFFFGPGSEKMGHCYLMSNTTLGVVKPHAVKEGCLGPILSQIQESFDISACQMTAITKTDASDFLEVYRGVLPASEFHDALTELASGLLVAVEVAVKGNRGAPACEAFRELCGPRDPDIARILRPTTLRAKFGRDKVRSAVHCTDLDEDCNLEIDYFFRIMTAPTPNL